MAGGEAREEESESGSTVNGTSPGKSVEHHRTHSWPLDELVSDLTLSLLQAAAGGAPTPPLAWRRRLDANLRIPKEFSLSMSHMWTMARVGIRMYKYIGEERAAGRPPFIDPFRKRNPHSNHGVPLGGIGGGSIGRGWRGDFRRFQFLPGVCEDAPVMANQFSAFVVRGSSGPEARSYSSVLYPGKRKDIVNLVQGFKSNRKMLKDDRGIGSWDWGLDGRNSTYHALFPRAWTIYDGEPDPELKICCRQVSPFIPHNYRDSCLPCCAFSFLLVNTGNENAQVTLLFTFANSIGGLSHLSGGHFNTSFEETDGVHGVLLHHKPTGAPPITLAIASQQTEHVHVSVSPRFTITGQDGQCTAKDMWEEVRQNGFFFKSSDERNIASAPGCAIGAAVAAFTVVPPGTSREVVFSLVWDAPMVQFLEGPSYYRRYTKFYGAHGNAAVKLAHDAICKHRDWESAIEAWQLPILQDTKLPEWYRITLFNELYYLVAGGSIWIDGPVFRKSECDESEEPLLLEKTVDGGIYDSDPSQDIPRQSDDFSTRLPSSSLMESRQETLIEGSVTCSIGEGVDTLGGANMEDDKRESEQKSVGHFLYLEGIEYHMWNTYDVHFYASFALIYLFPKLELSLQRDIAIASLHEISDDVLFLAGGEQGIRKVAGCVPHDMGLSHPWIKLNVYNLHDTSQWKDLNSKFVLQVYRDYVATGDMEFAHSVHKSVCTVMDYLLKFDKDGDGLIENENFPDQTYDMWPAQGPSAYCGGLWLAALQAAAALSEAIGDKEMSERYMSILQKGRQSFVEKLWNGSYFNYDSSQGAERTCIQADQVAGQWYTWACGLPPLFRGNKAQMALETIFNNNVMKVCEGRAGAVNGMYPNGKVDSGNMQSREVWTGVTYGVAAAMIYEGMVKEAFTTAQGVFQAGWCKYGYWFQTPEAWTLDGRFRSLTYMRPLAIWAMQFALQPPESTAKAIAKVRNDLPTAAAAAAD